MLLSGRFYLIRKTPFLQKWSDLPDSLSWLWQIICRPNWKNSVTESQRASMGCKDDEHRQQRTSGTRLEWTPSHRLGRSYGMHFCIRTFLCVILDQHPFLHSRCVMESWYINNIPETLNREKGLLPETYLSLPSTLQTPRSLPPTTITTLTDYPDIWHSWLKAPKPNS